MDYNREVMEIWHKVIEENRDVFEADGDKIFSAVKTAVQCRAVAKSDGFLALEEYVDSECRVEQSEIPLWGYLRTIIWILVDMEGAVDERILEWMLISLHKIWHYTGYQAIQGCIYLIFAFDFLISNQSADDLLLHYRSLVPEGMKAAFDVYFGR